MESVRSETPHRQHDERVLPGTGEVGAPDPMASSIAADLSAGPGADSTFDPVADLAARLAATWSGLSGYVVVRWAVRPLAARSHRTVQSIAFTVLVLALGVAGALLTGEPLSMLVLQGWAASLLLAVLLAFDALGDSLLRTLREEILPGLPTERLAAAAAELQDSILLRLEPLLSWGIGFLTALLLAPGLYLILGVVAPFTYLVVIVGSAVTVSMIYIPASVTTALLLFTAGEVALPPLRPEESRLVQGWHSITRRVSSTAALVATIGVLGPFLVPGLGRAAAVVAVLVFAGATSAVLVQIVLQQLRLGALIGRHRGRISRGLLAELSECYDQRHDPSEDLLARVELLLHLRKLADRPATTHPWLSAGLRQLAPMALPLLSLLAGTVELPFLERDTFIFLILEKVLDLF